MALFGKKKEVRELKLPEAPMMFPELPIEAEQHEHESNMPTLPKLQPVSMSSLPQIPPMERERPSQMMMPMPVARMPEAKLPPVPQIPSPRMMPKESMAMQSRAGMMKEPIFIKIDRYREAMANFELVKKRLQETSSLLDKIKETRKREEEELDAWVRELESIKMKIGSIDKKIFSSLD